MKSKKETFASLLESLAYRYDLRPVFDDLLTLMLCSFSQDVTTGKSHDEDLYIETIAKYQKADVRELFPKMLALLIAEMEDRIDSSSGNDVLGEFYELNFCRKGAAQFFTPWHICEMMSTIAVGDAHKEIDRRLRIIDPTCGSGRMLLTGAKNIGRQHEYYGIDIDHTCVKITALNLFLNGIFHGEVMCADALSPDDFNVSYTLSFLPFGIFRIMDKERSRLWHMHRNSFPSRQTDPGAALILPSQDDTQAGPTSQLQLF